VQKIIKPLYRLIIFIILTVITQIGGIVYLFSLLINKIWKSKLRFKPILSFIVIYIFAVFLIVPFIAPIFGREKIKHSEKIKPTNYLTVLLNRNYVRPELNIMFANAEMQLKETDIGIRFLDANFPFINKFPLLPHLSHNDGKKVDISLIYENEKGEITNRQKSISGYGVFESPNFREYNQIEKCLNSGYFQYDYPKYMTLGTINKDLKFSQKGTKTLIDILLKNRDLGKLFIEPHLANRLNLNDSRIRYHGCRAVRHDDHIHIQLN